MIDFPSTELLDDRLCTRWPERHRHPDGLQWPHGGRTARRLFRHQDPFPADRCRGCDGSYTRLTGTAFENTRPRPATLGLLLRGIAKGEPTARLARELGLPRNQRQTLRPRLQAHLNDRAPTAVMTGTAFEADELDQHAGEKTTPHPDPTDPPRRRANKRQGHGTSANAPPPSSGWCRRTRASSAFGSASTRPHGPATS